jgi:hypothetical protein
LQVCLPQALVGGLSQQQALLVREILHGVCLWCNFMALLVPSVARWCGRYVLEGVVLIVR